MATNGLSATTGSLASQSGEMKVTKYILYTLLVTIGLLIMGELSVLHINSLDTFYYSADFYFPKEITPEENYRIIKDLIEAGEGTGVDFFAIDDALETRSMYNTIIIGTDGAIDCLKNDGLSEGDHASLFFPTEKIEYVPIEDYKSISKIRELYFIGDEKDLDRLRNFKAELIDKYSGGYPKEKGSDAEMMVTVFAVWGLIISILFAFSAYEALRAKKENAVKTILGIDLKKVLIRDCILDTLVFVCIFVVLRRVLSNISDVRFKESSIAVFVMVYIIFNIIAAIKGYSIDYKRDLGDATNGKRVLSINYAIKVIASIVMILLVSLNISAIGSAYQLYKQKDFFEAHKDYFFYAIGSDAYEETESEYLDQELMHMKFHKEFQDSALMYIDLTGNYDVLYPFVLVNRKAFEELANQCEQIEVISERVRNSKVSVLFPSTVIEGTDLHESIQMVNSHGDFYNAREYGSWNEGIYRPGIDVEAFHDDGMHFNINMYKDPVILVDNTVYNGEPNSTGYDTYYSYDIMYKLDDQEWNEFIKGNGLESKYLEITNAFEEYTDRWNQKRQILMLTVSMSAFALFLSISLIVMILKTEYYVNSIEMALMKVHGYSLTERNTRILRTTILSGAAGLMLAVVVNIILRLGASAYALIGVGCFLVTLELIIIMMKAYAVEKKRIYQILKGEAI